MSEAEAPVWVRYAGDIFFLILFLVIFFFIKPDQKTEYHENNDETPNPLEAMLVTEEKPDEENAQNDETGKPAGDNE